MSATGEDICYAGAADLSRALAGGQLSPVDIVGTLLDRIDLLEPKLGAFVEVYRDKAMAAARRTARFTACRWC